MRYHTSKERIELVINEANIEDIVLAIHSLVVPRYTRKLYFLHQIEGTWPRLDALAKQEPSFTVIPWDNCPSNLLRTFRVVHSDTGLYVVAGSDANLNKEDWKMLLAKLSDVSA